MLSRGLEPMTETQYHPPVTAEPIRTYKDARKIEPIGELYDKITRNRKRPTK